MSASKGRLKRHTVEQGDGVSSSDEPGRRPRLLFLCQTLPFPPDGGVSIRTFHVLRLLSGVFDVTALCFYRSNDRPSGGEVQSAVAGLSEFADVEAFPIPQEHDRRRLLWDHARSLLLGRAYTAFAYESPTFRARLKELLKTADFDLAHVDSLDLSGYLTTLKDIPTICVHHNVESALLRRRAQAERSVWRKLYISRQATLLEREERHWCARVSKNVVVSSLDMSELQLRVPAARFFVVPNGVDVEKFRPRTGNEEGIVFVGGANWFPNRDALSYFCTEILPLIRAREADVSVSWVGRASDDDRKAYSAHHAMDLTGYVEDVRPFVHRAACYVVPLRVGGGTRLKILDAWAMGKAVVSTSIGCEGLEAIDDENILIRGTPEGFAAAVCEVLASEQLRRRLGASARDTVERHYSWETIGETMLEEYLRTIGRGWQAS